MHISSNFDSTLAQKESSPPKKICFKEIDDIIKIELSEINFHSDVLSHKSMYNSSEISKDFYSKISKDLGRTQFYEHFFLWFKDYFKNYLKTMQTLMSGDGFIPRTWRYYIALMAASAMRCEYLFKTLEEDFLEIGGDESWLIYGLDVIPEKLKKLSRINNLLAHQPWKIITEDIKVIISTYLLLRILPVKGIRMITRPGIWVSSCRLL